MKAPIAWYVRLIPWWRARAEANWWRYQAEVAEHENEWLRALYTGACPKCGHIITADEAINIRWAQERSAKQEWWKPAYRLESPDDPMPEVPL